MVVYLNGEFVPAAEARLSVFDRAVLYGDSLFETMRVCNGRVFRWHQHLERFQRGLEFLRFHCPVSPADLRQAARRLLELNGLQDGLLRLMLTRGMGPRGYLPDGAHSPGVVLTVEETPRLPVEPLPRWRMVTSSLRVPQADPLAQHKTGSKMLQILARMQAAAAGADEALFLNTVGEVAEAASGNLFWTRGSVVYTSPTAVGLLPGITRAVLLEICAAHQIPVKKRLTKLDVLKTSDALLLTNSAHGVVEIAALDDHTFPGNPLVARLRRLYVEVVYKECGLSVSPGDASPTAAPQPSPALP